MRTLFTKHFWTMNVAAMALLGWMSAGTVNVMTGGALFVAPEAPKMEQSIADLSAEAKKGRVKDEAGAVDSLTERNIFDLNPREDEVAAGDDDGDSQEEETAPPTQEGELEESSLPINLMGTLVSPDATQSMATLSVDGSNKIAWVGSEFLEGKAKVIAIAPRHVVVQEGLGLKVIKLWSDRAATAGKGSKRSANRGGRDRGGRDDKSARASKTSKPKPAKPKSATQNYSEGVKKTGPYDYNIDRGMLDKQLEDISALGKQARVVPNYRNGKYEGFKLVGVRPGSLYRAIGIRSGDVIKSINGKAIDSPNKALSLFEQLKGSSNINLEIERRGQPKQLNYEIK
jgi:general secretion pathway protein C